MRIAIDARWIFAEISGIGAYTRELISHLALVDRENTYILLFDQTALLRRTMEETSLAQVANFCAARLPYGPFSAIGQACLPLWLKAHGIDLFHSTNYMVPFLSFPRRRPGRTKCVVTIHDVIPLIFPQHAPKSKKSRLFGLYRHLMREVGVRADAIITDSKASRADVIKHLRIPPEKAERVIAVYCGVSPPSKPVARRSSHGPQRRILYVGRSDPYKNLSTLIKAFARLREKTDMPLQLTVAGSPDPRYPEASRLAARLGVVNAVHWTGYLSDRELASVYAESDLLVHPSRYEGFGLQILEAMANGLPVICSRAGSLPEVAGNAAIQLDPDDVEGFSRNMLAVLSDPQLAAQMRQRGREQVEHFTWKKTAEETLEVYNRAAGEGSRSIA